MGVYQHPRNPTARDRVILTLITERHTHKSNPLDISASSPAPSPAP
jgi:hypothetical protein